MYTPYIELSPLLQALFCQWLSSEADAGAGAEEGEALSLTDLLVDDIASNMLAATVPSSHAEERKMRESLHPHFFQCDLRDEVVIPGARALWVTFDPRCNTHPEARLSFFARDGDAYVALPAPSTHFLCNLKFLV